MKPGRRPVWHLARAEIALLAISLTLNRRVGRCTNAKHGGLVAAGAVEAGVVLAVRQMAGGGL